MALVLVSIGLALVAWASMLNIAVHFSVQYTMSLTGATSGQRLGIIQTARFAGLFCGGILWLGWIIASIAIHSDHLGQRLSWKMLTWTLIIEVIVIGLERLI